MSLLTSGRKKRGGGEEAFCLPCRAAQRKFWKTVGGFSKSKSVAKASHVISKKKACLSLPASSRHWQAEPLVSVTVTNSRAGTINE